jgi:aspartate/methionine/tyrosine aminotransferase
MNWKPDACGSLRAREAVSRFLIRGEFVCDAGRLLLLPGTSDAYSLLFKVLCDPREVILVPRPGYPLLDVLASLENLECASYGLNLVDGAWRIDWESLNAAPHAKILLVVNPNNPTGSVLSLEEWERLVSYCVAREMAIVVDEVFCDFPLDDMPVVPWNDYASRVPLFRLNGLSKSAGLPQVKLSWIWVGCPEADFSPLMAALEYVADAYLGLSALAESLAPVLLQNQAPYRDRVLERMHVNLDVARKALGSKVDDMPVPQGGWYLSFRCEGLDDEAFALELATEDGVLVLPGYFFDFAEDGWIVLSLLALPDVFSAGVEKIAKRLLQ